MVATDLQLHWLELTAAQIRLEQASPQEIRELRELLEARDITPTAFGPIRLADDGHREPRALRPGPRSGHPKPHLHSGVERPGRSRTAGRRIRMRLAIHNNATGAPFETIAAVLSAVEGRAPHVGACLDIGNVLRGSEDPAEAVRRLGSRLFGIHLKDVSGRDPDSEVIVLGKGFLDVPAFFTAVEEVGFPPDGALSVEYLERPDDPLPGIREGLQIAAAATNG